MKDGITIAVSKGRILAEFLPLLARADIRPLDDPDTTRKLIFETNHPGVRLIVIRAADVPTYVLNGGADLGIAGKDVLMECDSDNLYEPLDLDIARCRRKVQRRWQAAYALLRNTLRQPGIILPKEVSRWKSSSYTAPWNWRPCWDCPT